MLHLLFHLIVHFVTKEPDPRLVPKDPVPPGDNLAELERMLAAGRVHAAFAVFRVADFLSPSTPEERPALTRRLVESMAAMCVIDARPELERPLARLRSGVTVLGELAAEVAIAPRREKRAELARQEAELVRAIESLWNKLQDKVASDARIHQERHTKPIEERPADAKLAAECRARAEAHAAAGRFDDACFEYERVHGLDRSPATAARLEELKVLRDVANVRTWAERHVAAGRTADAIECYERLLRRAPGDTAAAARLAELRGGPGSAPS